MKYNVLKLADLIVCYDKKRKPLSTMQRSNIKGVYPYYGAQEVIDYINDYIFDGKYLLFAEDGENLRSKQKPLVNVVEGKFWLNNHAHIFTNINKVDFDFLYYSLISTDISHLITGTTQPKLNQENLMKIEIKVPEMNIQKKIGKILKLFDDKIKLNNDININLYNILKNEFRAKYYLTKGEKVLLSDLIESTIGGDWGKEAPQGNNNTKVYCVRGADIPNMEYGNKGNAPERYILEKNYNNKKLEANNIIVEISGGSPTQSTGRTAYITENILNMYDSPLLCTNFCKAMKIKDKKKAPFAYMIFKLQYDDGIFFSWENGTTGIKNFALNDMLNNTEVVLPSDEEIEKYYELFNTLMDKIAANSKQNHVLQQLRDTLLPKLMNGEIDLDNIEI